MLAMWKGESKGNRFLDCKLFGTIYRDTVYAGYLTAEIAALVGTQLCTFS